MSGSFSVGYNECLFSINKTTLQPIPKPVGEHEVEKAAQMVEDGNDVESVDLLT